MEVEFFSKNSLFILNVLVFIFFILCSIIELNQCVIFYVRGEKIISFWIFWLSSGSYLISSAYFSTGYSYFLVFSESLMSEGDRILEFWTRPSKYS